MHLRVTRDYGRTADEKVNDLIEALLVAIAIVVLLLAYTLGWREGIIIALAVPVTFSFTLLINLLLGYTINRVTLFALILALGLVVDDPIVDVENIHRHFAMRTQKPFDAVVSAVNEVRPPIILATFAVIISFVPMFFITGMMGPYMAPMALNVPVAMLLSLLVAFTITPWLSLHMLKGSYDHPAHRAYMLEEDPFFKGYSRILDPMFKSRRLRRGLIALIGVLMAFAVWLVFSHRVPLKMLPFDNKNEFDVVIDMPEGTSLEQTEAAAHDIAGYLNDPACVEAQTFHHSTYALRGTADEARLVVTLTAGARPIGVVTVERYVTQRDPHELPGNCPTCCISCRYAASRVGERHDPCGVSDNRSGRAGRPRHAAHRDACARVGLQAPLGCDYALLYLVDDSRRTAGIAAGVGRPRSDESGEAAQGSRWPAAIPR